MGKPVLISKVTAKGQATIPAAVRKHLGIAGGDALVFTIDNDTVTVSRAEPLDAGFLKLATESFTEWNSAEDDEAFRDL